jgi:outer membrane receptor protein involved in Fe transport
MSIARLNLALDAVEDDQGNIVCRSGGNCVPYNVFEEGAITREMTDYLKADIVMNGRVTTQVVNLTFTGDLEDYGIRIPSASEGLALAAGFEWRGESIASFPDEIYQFGGATGQGGGVPKVDAGYEVQEFFLELAVPIVQDRSAFQDLTLELGYRFSDYSTSGGLDAYKALLNWAINDSFRIRGGYNRAVRAPNVWQLFQPLRFGLGGSADICAGTNPSATLEQCQRTGMTEAQYGTAITENPADQYNTLGGGNPLLEPETADTITAGVVITPQGVPGLSLTLDYYDIQIEDTIGSLGFDDILQNCANTGNPVSCGLINRDNLGTLWLTQAGYISTQNNNIGELGAEGVDFNGNYMINLGGAGFLPIDLNGTYTMTNSIKNPLIDYDCVGFFGFQCGQPLPDWRHRLRATWETNFNLFVSLAWRYVGEVEVDDASDNPQLGDPGSMDLWRTNDIDKIPAYNWFDLSVSYLMKSGIRWTVGANNIFDEEPPLAPTFNDDFGVNLYSVYDPFGRYVFAGVQFSL